MCATQKKPKSEIKYETWKRRSRAGERMKKKTSDDNERYENKSKKRERNFRKGIVHARSHTARSEKTSAHIALILFVAVVVYHFVAQRQTAKIRHRKWEIQNFFDFWCVSAQKNNAFDECALVCACACVSRGALACVWCVSFVWVCTTTFDHRIVANMCIYRK